MTNEETRQAWDAHRKAAAAWRKAATRAHEADEAEARATCLNPDGDGEREERERADEACGQALRAAAKATRKAARLDQAGSWLDTAEGLEEEGRLRPLLTFKVWLEAVDS